MLLSVIIVSYNTKQLLLDTLNSVLINIKNSSLLNQSSEVLVVDNNSVDESVAASHQLLSTSGVAFEVIANQDNKGFASANNQALTKAQGTYILLLNSDTIVKPGALEQLVTTFEKNPIQESTADLQSAGKSIDRLGIVAAQLYNPDGSIQPQGGSFPTLFSLSSHMLMLDDIPVVGRFLPSTQHTGKRQSKIQGQHLLTMDWVGGTAMMIRKETLQETGPLDQNIFMYGEDVELCLRAQAHHWDIAIDPQAQIEHFGSASSTSENALKGELKGYLYLWSKHKPLWQLPLVKLVLKAGCLLRVVVFGTISNQPAKVAVYRSLLREL